MYRVKETITSLAHGKQFAAGAHLYGNEFPAYALAAMLAGGVIEEISAEPKEAEPIVEIEAVGPVIPAVQAEQGADDVEPDAPETAVDQAVEAEPEVDDRPRKKGKRG